MTTLLHITSLSNAISILKSGVFLTAGGGDACLNAFIAGQPANTAQCLEFTGSIMRFKWSGPMRINNEFPLEPDVLHIDLPWRAVVSAGSTRYLRLVGLRALRTEWLDEAGEAPWTCFTKGLKARFQSHRASLLRREIRELVALEPSITVALGRPNQFG